MHIANCMKTDTSIRINIPKLVREAMGLTRGTRVMFEVTGPGEAKIINLDRLVAGAIAKPVQP